MKKVLNIKLLCLAIPFFGLMHCYAQQPDDLQGFRGFNTPKPLHNAGVLKFGLTPVLMGQILFTGELRITYERKIAKHQTITIGASYDYPNLILLAASGANSHNGGGRHHNGVSNANINAYSIEGGRITLGYRYYPLKKQEGPKGFFVGPYVSYNAVNVRDKSNAANYQSINYFNADAITGYQFTFRNHFALEFFGGFGYRNNFVLHYNQLVNNFYDQYGIPQLTLKGNFKFVLQMNVGYAF